ncbi:MAG: pilus assembly protein TadG-related protein [Chloroflexota bacterium]|jgi:Flp pilus assembly protein TadG
MRRRHGSDGEHGQILVLFVISLLAIFAMAALLFDGANALVTKRRLQDAGDAAALAAANILQSGTTKGCSATAGPPPGAARAEVIAAAQAAVANSLPTLPTSQIHVSCPDGWSNYAVQVRLDQTANTYFGGVVGMRDIGVGTTSEAVNGQINSINYSVVLLDPSNATWPNGRRGCPALLISGGPTVTFDGSVQVNSACTQANGGALSVNGNASSVTMNNGATIRLVGGYAPGPATITPTPATGANPVGDPLAGLPTMPVASLPVRATTQQVYGASDVVLEPGVYQGGIQLKNSVKAFLRPGIYVMQGGGLDLGAQSGAYSVPATASTTTDATWATDCPASSCGVLIYNAGTSSGSGAMGPITVGAGATMRLRPYVPTVDRTNANVNEYRNILVWQDATPTPSTGYAQPIVSLGGGGTVDLSGSVYAPSAAVQMTGGSGGSGGTSDLTVQFICWDLTFSGNTTFHFHYQANSFPKPTDYGLIR